MLIVLARIYAFIVVANWGGWLSIAFIKWNASDTFDIAVNLNYLFETSILIPSIVTLIPVSLAPLFGIFVAKQRRQFKARQYPL